MAYSHGAILQSRIQPDARSEMTRCHQLQVWLSFAASVDYERTAICEGASGGKRGQVWNRPTYRPQSLGH